VRRCVKRLAFENKAQAGKHGQRATDRTIAMNGELTYLTKGLNNTCCPAHRQKMRSVWAAR
jgi:hypothetical protein